MSELKSTIKFNYTVSPTVRKDYLLPPNVFLTQNPHINCLMAGAIVFSSPHTPSNTDTPNSQLKALMLRRAAKDIFPLKWEVPGGSVDLPQPATPSSARQEGDSSLVHTAVRELFEEAHLTAKNVSHVIGSLPPELCPPVIADIDDSISEPHDVMHLFREGETVWGKVTFMVEVEEQGEGGVVIDPEEHCEYRWVTEAELLKGVFKDVERVDVVSEGVRRNVLEGFRVKKSLQEIS